MFRPDPRRTLVPTSTKLRRTLALALAAGSLAIGVPAALAATSGDDAAPATSSGAATPGFIQDAPEGGRAHRGDCPEHGGGGQNGSGDSGSAQGGSGGSGTTTPAPAL